MDTAAPGRHNRGGAIDRNQDMKKSFWRACALSGLLGIAAFHLSTPASAQNAGNPPETKSAAKPLTPALKARHERCLAFIRRQGLTCDPWVQPTCGADSGVARPLDCVAP